MEPPLGYREYVASLGLGTMCTDLIVRMPDEIRTPSREDDDLYWGVFEGACERVSTPDNIAGLDSSDFKEAIVFAYTDAEAPIYFATRARGSRLFEHAEGLTFEIENGFFGLVERHIAERELTFPFFEPKNGRRRMRQLSIRSEIGRTGFVEALARRWGRESIRCPCISSDDLYPDYFVSTIEGYFELHLDLRNTRLPGNSFFVRASYDIDSEADFADFVQPLLLPGGGPYDCSGEPFWLP